MTVKIPCVRCHEVYELKLDIRKYNKWRQGGGNIQDIFPEMPPEQRELLISQICHKCWDYMFGGLE